MSLFSLLLQYNPVFAKAVQVASTRPARPGHFDAILSCMFASDMNARAFCSVAGMLDGFDITYQLVTLLLNRREYHFHFSDLELDEWIDKWSIPVGYYLLGENVYLFDGYRLNLIQFTFDIVMSGELRVVDPSDPKVVVPDLDTYFKPVLFASEESSCTLRPHPDILQKKKSRKRAGRLSRMTRDARFRLSRKRKQMLKELPSVIPVGKQGFSVSQSEFSSELDLSCTKQTWSVGDQRILVVLTQLVKESESKFYYRYRLYKVLSDGDIVGFVPRLGQDSSLSEAQLYEKFQNVCPLIYRPKALDGRLLLF